MKLSLDGMSLAKLSKFGENLSSSECRKCSMSNLIIQNGHNPVSGSGTGRIMMVGMGPVIEAHDNGKDYKGKVGSLLRKQCSNIGLNLDLHFYLTNVMKCNHSMVDGKYKADQKRTCSVYLFKEIDIVDPQLIIFFGKESFEAIGFKDEFGGYGVPFKATIGVRKQWVLAMENPHNILYNEARQRMLTAQFIVLARWLENQHQYYSENGIKMPNVEHTNVSKNITIDTKEKAQHMMRYLTQAAKDTGLNTFAIDTETTGLDLYIKEFKTIGISLAADDKVGFYIPIGHLNRPGKLIKKKKIQQLSKKYVVSLLQYLFNKSGMHSVFHNFNYDYRVLWKLGVQIPRFDAKADSIYHDTLIMSYLYDENDGHGLKEQVFLRYLLKPRSFKEVAVGAEFQYVDIKTATEYAGDDALNTWRLYKYYRKHLVMLSKKRTGGKLLNEIYVDELRASKIMADAQNKGMRVDVDYLELAKKRLYREQNKLFKQMDSICNTIDHNSAFQIGRLIDSLMTDKSKRNSDDIKNARMGFEDEYGLSADEDTITQVKKFIEEQSNKGGKFKWTVDKLSKYTEVLFKHRRVTKLLSTYVLSILDKIVYDKDGVPIIHGGFSTASTTSGRMSSSNPNLQNLPRISDVHPEACEHCGHKNQELEYENEGKTVKETIVWYSDIDKTGGLHRCKDCGKVTSNYLIDIRQAFIPREGKVFLISDWDSMEWTIAGAVSGDKQLNEILEGQRIDPGNPNFDMHRITASGMYKKKPEEIVKSERSAAKPVGFGALYGISAIGLVRTLRKLAGIVVDQLTSQSFLDGFFNVYPGIKVWMDKSKTFLKKNGYITHPWGRIRNVNKNPTNEEIRSATNFIIQGWGASIMKRSLDVTMNNGYYEDSEVNLLSVIHDELILEIPINRAAEVYDAMYNAMNIEIEDVTKVKLSATPEFKYSLSKGAHSWSLEEFTNEFIKKAV